VLLLDRALRCAVVVLACSCGGAATEPLSPEPPIAAIHRARCGQCHVRVEPGTRTREKLTSALEKHRKRVHLSERDWDALVAYLAIAGSG